MKAIINKEVAIKKVLSSKGHLKCEKVGKAGPNA